MKYLPLLIIGIVLVSGCTTPDIKFPWTGGATATNSLYDKYNPQPYLDGWTLNHENKNLADMPDNIRKNLLLEGVSDVAFWEYQKGDLVARIWTKKIDDPDIFHQLQLNNYLATGAWRTQTILLYADVGLVGVRRIDNANDPLMIYLSKNQDMVYIFYYNMVGKTTKEPAYTDINQDEDQKFLIDLTKKILKVQNNDVTSAPEVE